jgi:hypothetical protein
LTKDNGKVDKDCILALNALWYCTFNPQGVPNYFAYKPYQAVDLSIQTLQNFN